MRCPLLVAIAIISGGGVNLTTMDCLEQECAWWGKRRIEEGTMMEACMIWQIGDLLHRLLDKIPHEGQFRL